MQNNAKVSVIVPVYNVEKYLSRCLDSIINQTLKEIEIICVNDGSTDNSRAILEEYKNKDSRIIIVDKKNGGLSSARNAGIKIATAPYIAFVDSDDWIETNTYETAIKYFDEDIDLVQYGTSVINEDFDEDDIVVKTSRNHHKIRRCGKFKIDNDVLMTTILTSWSKVFKRKIIINNNIEFPIGLLYEDIEFFYKYCVYAKNCYFIDKKLYNYTKRKNSILDNVYSNKYSFFKDHLEIIEHLYNYYTQLNVLPKYKNILLKRFNEFLIYDYNVSTKEGKTQVLEYAYNICKKFDKLHSNKLISNILNKKFYKIDGLNIEEKSKRRIFFNSLKLLFSITNENNHKIIKLFGIKIKFKRFWLHHLKLKFNKQRILSKKIILEKEKQKEFTKQNLDMVEIEIFSFCNRQCWFCPNSFIDRHSKNIFLPEESYLKIINELKEINYDGSITYSRYNEPLYDKIFLKRIKQARESLPNAFLFTHSNGDYINRDYLEELADAGLNLIKLQCYLGENESFDIEKIIKPRMEKIAQKLHLPYLINTDNKTHYEFEFRHPKIAVIIEANDFREIGVNRGDSVKKIRAYKRTEPCISPFYRLYIDYNGSVMPCCQTRHDNPKHQHMIMGNINQNSLFEIFTNAKFASLRSHLEKHGRKIYPCNSCKGTIKDDVGTKESVSFTNILKNKYKRG